MATRTGCPCAAPCLTTPWPSIPCAPVSPETELSHSSPARPPSCSPYRAFPWTPVPERSQSRRLSSDLRGSRKAMSSHVTTQVPSMRLGVDIQRASRNRFTCTWGLLGLLIRRKSSSLPVAAYRLCHSTPTSHIGGIAWSAAAQTSAGSSKYLPSTGDTFAPADEAHTWGGWRTLRSKHGPAPPNERTWRTWGCFWPAF